MADELYDYYDVKDGWSLEVGVPLVSCLKSTEGNLNNYILCLSCIMGRLLILNITQFSVARYHVTLNCNCEWL